MDSAACPAQRRCSPGPAHSFHALWPPSGDAIILSLNLGFVVTSDRTAEHVLEMWSSSSSLVPPPTASGMDSPPPQRRLPPSAPAGPGTVAGEVRCGAHAHAMRCGLLASLGSAFTYKCPCARENTALNSREQRRTDLRASTGRGRRSSPRLEQEPGVCISHCVPPMLAWLSLTFCGPGPHRSHDCPGLSHAFAQWKC